VPDDPFDPDESARFQPATPQTQEELGGVLERAFMRERGKEPNEGEGRRLHALADEALRQAEIKLGLAREAEAAMARATERYGRSEDPGDLAAVEKWTSAVQSYRREAEQLRLKAEDLRQRIV
jgi:hypothetical protein